MNASDAGIVDDATRAGALERTLSRLALSADDAMEKILSVLLPKVIAEIHAPGAGPATRRSALALLSHVSRRIKTLQNIQLPLVALLGCASVDLNDRSEGVIIARNFALVYANMAFKRAGPETRAQALIKLIPLLSRRSQKEQQKILIRMALLAGEHFHRGHDRLPQNTPWSWKDLRELATEQDIALFIERLVHLVLIVTPGSRRGPEGEVLWLTDTKAMVKSPPGLSREEFEALVGDNEVDLSPQSLALKKKGAVNVAVGGVFDDSKVAANKLLHLFIVMACDGDVSVAGRGEELLRRHTALADMENETLVDNLFQLYSRNGTSSQDSPHTGIEAMIARTLLEHSPLSTNTSISILSHLGKSLRAAKSRRAMPDVVIPTIEAAKSRSLSSRLLVAGLEFGLWVLKHCESDILERDVDKFVESAEGLLLSNLDAFTGLTSKLRTLALSGMSIAIERLPTIIERRPGTLETLLDALSSSEGSKLAENEITEMLMSLTSSFKTVEVQVLAKLIDLIETSLSAQNSAAVRQVASHWAGFAYPESFMPSRYLCVLASADDLPSVAKIGTQGCLRSAPPQVAQIIAYVTEKHPSWSNLRPEALPGLILLIDNAWTSHPLVQINQEQCDLLFQLLCSGLESANENAKALSAGMMLRLVESQTQWTIPLDKMKGMVSKLLSSIGDANVKVRRATASLIAAIGCQMGESQMEDILNDIMERLESGKAYQLKPEFIDGCLETIVKLAAMSRAWSSALVPRILSCICGFLNPKISPRMHELRASAAKALGIVVMAFPSEFTSLSNSEEIVDQLSKHCQDAEQPEVALSCVGCLGKIAHGVATMASDIVSKLMNLSSHKNEDMMFAIVPAPLQVIVKSREFALFVGELQSGEAEESNQLPVGGPSIVEAVSADDETYRASRLKLLNTILSEKIYDTDQTVQGHAVIWLVSLIRYIGRHKDIQGVLAKAQEALTDSLANENETIQELASRGMSIVFELSSEDMKKDLVNRLVDALAGRSQLTRSIKVNDGTQIFGGSSSARENVKSKNAMTYKELLSMANEMGDSSMVYKLMDIANHFALLHSRRGAAFGLIDIAKQSREQFKEHLPKLVPRLFRMRYDPNKATQDAMANIWKSLLPNPNQQVEDYFDLIVKDLLDNLGSKMWRYRQSACDAFVDLIQGRVWKQIGSEYSNIWNLSMRCIDDVKDSVRQAALSLVRALTSFSVRVCDLTCNSLQAITEPVNVVVPLLISQATNAEAVEVKAVSLSCLFSVVKVCGSSLQQHVASLVPSLLTLLGESESGKLNYLQMHADRLDVDTRKLDEARVGAAASGYSPFDECLDYCREAVDKEAMVELVPNLVSVLKQGIGLHTRIGTSKFVNALLVRKRETVKPMAGKLIRAFISASQREKSHAVKKRFLSVAAELANLNCDKHMPKLLEEFERLWDEDKENDLCTAGILIQKCAAYAGDGFAMHAGLFLSRAFVARCNEDRTTSEIWDEIWDNNISGETTALQHHFKAIVSVISQELQAKSWVRRRQSAVSITKADDTSHRIWQNEDGLDMLVQGLGALSKSRQWQGKEDLVRSCCVLGGRCLASVTLSGTQPDTVQSAQSQLLLVLREELDRKQEARKVAADCIKALVETSLSTVEEHRAAGALPERLNAWMVEFSLSIVSKFDILEVLAASSASKPQASSEEPKQATLNNDWIVRLFSVFDLIKTVQLVPFDESACLAMIKPIVGFFEGVDAQDDVWASFRVDTKNSMIGKLTPLVKLVQGDSVPERVKESLLHRLQSVAVSFVARLATETKYSNLRSLSLTLLSQIEVGFWVDNPSVRELLDKLDADPHSRVRSQASELLATLANRMDTK